jgi:hypothetical protein
VRLLENQIIRWADKTFPNSRDYSKMMHLKKEVKELEEAVFFGKRADMIEEAADVAIILIHLIGTGDLKQAIRRKFKVLKKRKWGLPDADGVVEHIREEKLSSPLDSEPGGE